MKKLIVGLSGASGGIMGVQLLRALRALPDVETHLVVTDGALLSLSRETDVTREEVASLADHVYDVRDLAAPIASGSFLADGMIVCPCSMKSLAGLVTGYSENLLLRAADATLKEGAPVVLVPRETPLSRVHLRNLHEAGELGFLIVPPVLTFYSKADTLERQIDHIIGKVLHFFGITYEKFVPWQG